MSFRYKLLAAAMMCTNTRIPLLTKKNRETIAGFAEQSFKETFSINLYSMPQCGQGLHRSSHGC